MSAGSVLGTFSLLANGVAGAVTFLTFPWAYRATWSGLVMPTLASHAPWMQDHAWWIWGTITVIVLFALTRVALLFAISAVGLLIALRAFFRNRRS